MQGTKFRPAAKSGHIGDLSLLSYALGSLMVCCCKRNESLQVLEFSIRNPSSLRDLPMFPAENQLTMKHTFLQCTYVQ